MTSRSCWVITKAIKTTTFEHDSSQYDELNSVGPHSSHKTTINQITRPSTIRALIAQQESNQFRHFLSLTDSINACFQSIQDLRICCNGVYHGCIDSARCDAVDPNIPVTLFQRCRFREANYCMLEKSF